jgi:large subunit ribosomal protein L17
VAGYRKLNRSSSHRKAMLRNLVSSLFKAEGGRIVTTETKGKEVQSLADKMITLAKRGDLHARRQALAFITEEEVVNKLFNDIAPRYTDRKGGYTRLIKMGPRRGDAAEQVIIELV